MLRAAMVISYCLVVLPAAAHDFWLAPSSFRPGSETEAVSIRLMVGDGFDGEPVGRNEPRIERFVVRDASGERSVEGRQGADPAGTVAVTGPAIVGYRSRPIRHADMPAAKFESYLREEGLQSVIEQRARAGQTSKPGREIYSRSAKTILAGAGPSRHHERLGFRLEIVPENDPTTATELRLRVWFENDPVEGLLISALRAGGGRRASARTDRDGRVSLPIGGNGVWLIKSVHMVAAPPGSGADWESIWATLTFERAAP